MRKRSGRYDKDFPVVSFRLSRDLKELLFDEVGASNQTIREWIEECLTKRAEIKKQIEHLKNENINLKVEIDILRERIEKLRKLDRITIPCAKCGKPIVLDSNHPKWKSEIYPKLLRIFGGKWSHGDVSYCLNTKSEGR